MASLATIIADAEKGIEIGAEDLLKLVGTAQKVAPGVLAAVGILAGGVTKALTDVEGAAASSGLNIALDEQTLTDLKAVWPQVKAFLLTLGIKIA